MEEPTPKDDELLVKVHASTVNQTDAHYRAAKPFPMRLLSGVTRPKVTVLGNEFAGRVEAVGSGVTSFKVGDRVFGYNEGTFGAHAEYMLIRANGLLAIMPANLTYEQAAPARRDRTMRSRASGGRRSESRRLLKPGGIYMSTGPGPAYQNAVLPLITPLLPGKTVVFAYPHFDQATVRYFKELIEAGEFRPVIDRCYPLGQIVEAYRYVETDQKIGNVVISVDPSD